jgi:hypothetical protein
MDHEHPTASANGHGHGGETAVAPQREPNAFTIIRNLNKSLDQRANEVRQLQDREVYLSAIIDDLEAENAALKAVFDKVRVENQTLRQSLDLPELGVVTEAEVD